MEILYISNTTSQGYFDNLYSISKIKPGQQVQKFNEMLLRGFAQNTDCNITALSIAPATRKTCDKKSFENMTERENDICYSYAGFINRPILKQLTAKTNAKKIISKWADNTAGKERVIICYAISPTLSDIAIWAGNKFGIKTAALVTDVPQHMNVEKKTSSVKAKLYDLYSKAVRKTIVKYDCYILLTEQMTKLVNPIGKPYIVMEGMVDDKMKHMTGDNATKYSPRVILYAGALFEKYGVKNLVEGFISAKMKDCELWLFGSGEMDEHLEKPGCDSVKYFGVVKNTEVIQHELKATLLVNPRPSTEEFTKYSFPSKNLEYMSTGTPTLTCKLPGMPDEYLDYVYITYDESAEGFGKRLTEIMSYNEDELLKMGKMAKQFVMNKKTNQMQAGRILEYIKDYLL